LLGNKAMARQRRYLAGLVEQQLKHHRTRTFQEQYLAFLKKHGSPWDEKYHRFRYAPSYRQSGSDRLAGGPF
jgi:hypothetical protein